MARDIVLALAVAYMYWLWHIHVCIGCGIYVLAAAYALAAVHALAVEHRLARDPVLMLAAWGRTPQPQWLDPGALAALHMWAGAWLFTVPALAGCTCL